MERPALRRGFQGLIVAFALAFATLVFPGAARADISPEFQLLLNDIGGDFKVNGPSLKDCDGSALEIARQAMQRRFISNAMAGPVVISAFENVCKPFLDALGLGAIGTGYSVAKCAFEYLDATTSTDGFAKCLGAEGISFVAGKVLGALGAGDVSGAAANVPIGKALDQLKGTDWSGVNSLDDMIAQWKAAGSKPEFDSVQYGPDQGFPCQVDVSVKWAKPQNPARSDGEILISVAISGCNCEKTATSYSPGIESGSVRYRVPVKFTRGPGGAPAWYVDNPRATLEVHSRCCGRRSTTIRHYSNAGTQIGPTATEVDGSGPGPVTDGPPPPVGPPPPPPVTPPPPVKPPPPPWPQDTGAQLAMCPECASIAHDIELTRAGIADASTRVSRVAAAIAANEALQAAARARIAAAQAELNAQAGTGGSGFDPDTGNTTSAVTQSDGTVLVTTKGPGGSVIEQHTRPRRDLAKAKDDLAQGQAQLDQAKAEGASLAKQLASARAALDKLTADLEALQQSLAACLAACQERLTRGGLISVVNVIHVSGNNPFDPLDPLGGGTPSSGGGTTGPGGCTAPRPPDDTRMVSCPVGQTGVITQVQTHSCEGTTWVPDGFLTTSNTCSAQPTGCTQPQPGPDTQTLPCPSGQVGSITQMRTYSCVGTNWVPGAFTTTSNTCTTPAPTGCAANFTTGGYSCSGSCGIGSTNLSTTPSSNTMTLNPFGANSNATFSCSGPSASSTSSNLTILGAQGHNCSLSAGGASSFGIMCRNTSGGSCTSSCSR